MPSPADRPSAPAPADVSPGMSKEEQAGPRQHELHFDASFESGNLAEVKLVSEMPLEYDLHIRPDTLNARHRVWFFF